MTFGFPEFPKVADTSSTVGDENTDATPASLPVETQDQAIAAIEKLGGKVMIHTNIKCPNKSVVDVSFTNETKLSITNENFTNETKITDDGLVHLKGLNNLKTLNLQNTKITDEGLVHLKGLANLQTLNLYDTKVTDAGLEHLKGLTKLKTPNLSTTQITDAGLENLKGLTNLQVLMLTGTKVTDKGVKKLQTALPNCGIRH